MNQIKVNSRPREIIVIGRESNCFLAITGESVRASRREREREIRIARVYVHACVRACVCATRRAARKNNKVSRSGCGIKSPGDFSYI